MALLHPVSQHVLQKKSYSCLREGGNYNRGVTCLKSQFFTVVISTLLAKELKTKKTQPTKDYVGAGNMRDTFNDCY